MAALLIGFVLGRLSIRQASPGAGENVADQATIGHPGPWGRIESIPIALECPDELLPVHAFETKVTHWVLAGYTVEKMFHLLDELGIAGELREQFRSPEVLHVTDSGLDLTPTQSIVTNLPPKARKDLYSLLASNPENGSSLIFVLARTLDERFRGSGVSALTVESFKKLSCEYGRYLVFSDVPTIFSLIPTYEERVRFLKALTRQSSLLVKLRVTPNSDTDALTNYWGKAGGAKDVRPLIESLARVPGGARLGLVNLLPPGPAARLYNFPVPPNPLNGPAVKQDCHWTAFNFFRDPPDDHYSNADYLREKLRDDHFPVLSDPRYGDLVLFVTPDGQLIHSAVYLADDIVYTKNGDSSLHPWMLSTVQDLLDQYSFQVPPDKALQVQYFRNKYY